MVPSLWDLRHLVTMVDNGFRGSCLLRLLDSRLYVLVHCGLGSVRADQRFHYGRCFSTPLLLASCCLVECDMGAVPCDMLLFGKLEAITCSLSDK